MLIDSQLMAKLVAIPMPGAALRAVLTALTEHECTEPSPTLKPATVRKQRQRDKERDMSRFGHANVTPESVTCHADVTPMSRETPPPSPPFPIPHPPTPTPTPHTPHAYTREDGLWPDPREYPTLDSVKAWAIAVMAPAECAEKWHAERTAEGWTANNGRKPLRCEESALRPLFVVYATAWKANAAKGPYRRNGNGKPPANADDIKPSWEEE